MIKITKNRVYYPSRYYKKNTCNYRACPFWYSGYCMCYRSEPCYPLLKNEECKKAHFREGDTQYLKKILRSRTYLIYPKDFNFFDKIPEEVTNAGESYYYLKVTDVFDNGEVEVVWKHKKFKVTSRVRLKTMLTLEMRERYQDWISEVISHPNFLDLAA